MPVIDLIPEDFREGAKKIVKAMQSPDFDQVLISAHVNPDGDAVGSLKMGSLLLEALGKRFALYVTPQIPDFLQILSFPNLYHRLSDFPFKPKCAFILDCGDFIRLGSELEGQALSFERINVDHHEGSGIATLAAWIEPKAASTTVLLAYLAHTLGLELQGELGQACALGILTDTGGFAHSNTSAQVFELCAHLAAHGVDFVALREALEHSIPIERMHLWGALTSKVKFLAQGRIAYCPVRLADLQKFGAKREDLEGLVEYLRKLKGVKIAAMLREDAPEICKFSLRSAKDYDVWAIAQKLKGGGHRNASGGTLPEIFSVAEEHLWQALLN